MEIQEFLPRALVSQLRFSPSPLFADVRGALVRELSAAADLPTWEWSLAQVRLTGAVNVLVGGHEARVQTDDLADLDRVTHTTEAVFTRVLDVLDVEKVGFIGVRSYWAAAVASFEALRDALVRGLSPKTAELGTVLGRPLSDAGWVLEYHVSDPKYTLRFGPMTREQALGPYFTPETIEVLPPVSLFLDFDRIYNEREMSPRDAVARWHDSYTKSFAHAEKVGAVLSGIAKSA